MGNSSVNNKIIADTITTSHLNNCWNGEGRKNFDFSNFSNFGLLNNRIWGTKKIYLGSDLIYLGRKKFISIIF